MSTMNPDTQYALAIVGLACEFPGAQNPQEFWKLLSQGRETITHFSNQELIAAGVNEADLKHDHYVKARGILKDIELFDPEFFGYSPLEAKILDPQHRLFLKNAWIALEDAGCVSDRYKDVIGVFTGTNDSDYFENHLLKNKQITQQVSLMQLQIACASAFISTRTSYKLNLKGPSISLNTACSTALTAIIYACKSLLEFECDLALAGGVSLTVPQITGYEYQKGGINSPDGHCRAFDHKAAGAVPSSGVGVVALKRLEDALAQRDHIYAVIQGFALNNDGADKVGYTAPSINGQASCIASALALAGLTPNQISYLETHGTGTALGDVIEIEALKKVWRSAFDSSATCVLGSVKTNIGHTDIAAGAAGLIKTALMLQHQQLPPHLHYEKPNPELELEHSPFTVNTQLKPWLSTTPRRAGVSSFGIGGTNAHVILEEAPQRPQSGPGRPWQLLTFSAKTAAALAANLQAFHEYLNQRQTPSTNEWADSVYSLNSGRKNFAHRQAVICQTMEQAIHVLADPSLYTQTQICEQPTPITLYLHDCDHYPCFLDIEIYQNEPVIQAFIEEYSPLAQIDFKSALLSPRNSNDLNQYLAGLAIQFILAQQLINLDLAPERYDCQGTGLLVAACLTGFIQFADMLQVIPFWHTAKFFPSANSLSALQQALTQLSFAEDRFNTFQQLTQHTHSITAWRDTHFWLEKLSLCATNITEQQSFKIDFINSAQCSNDCFNSESLLNLIKQCWLHGHHVDWRRYYQHETRNRVSLPGYQFQSKRYWVEPDTVSNTSQAEKQLDLEHCLHAPVWVHQQPLYAQLDLKPYLSDAGPWLIFAEEDLFSQRLIQYLQAQHQSVITVYQDHTYQCQSANRYRINPEHPQDYHHLITDLKCHQLLPRRVLHLWTLPDAKTVETLQDVNRWQYAGFYSLLFLTQAFCAENQHQPLNIMTLSTQLYSISGHEKICPEKITLLGACKVIPQEQESIYIANIDLDAQELDHPTLIPNILLDSLQIKKHHRDSILAYRQNWRWQQKWTPAQLEHPISRIKNGGVYLITGGLGAIGLKAAEYIAKQAPATLILLNRSEFPAKNRWMDWLAQYATHDPTSMRIQNIKKIEALGSSVIMRSIDISNAKTLKNALTEINAQYGKISGVIHCAGVPGGGIAALKTISMSEQVFKPKLYGTFLLRHLLHNEKLDFFISCSSLNAIIGGPSQADYCAANLYLDACTQQSGFTHSTFFSSINWNGWRDSGMLSQANVSADMLRVIHLNIIDPLDGEKILTKAFTASHPQLAVSMIDLDQQMDKAYTYLELTKNLETTHNDHPQTLQETLARIWKNLLDLEEIDADSDFFKLGGHSLLALQLIAAIHKQLNIEISLAVLYEHRSLHELSTYIQTQQKHNAQNSLTVLQSQGKQPPLFLIHPSGGTLFGYFDLCQELGKQRPIYGLQNPCLQAKKQLFSDLTEMALAYLEKIIEIDSAEGYWLGGFSFGGNLALEIAYHLNKRGKKIYPVLLLESWATYPREHFNADFFAQITEQNYRKNQELFMKAKLNNQHSLLESAWHCQQFIAKHQPRPFQGELWLYKAKEAENEYQLFDDPYNYWRLYYPQQLTRCEVFPGTHDTFLKPPYVKTFATKLNQDMQEFEQKQKKTAQNPSLSSVKT